MRGTRGFLSFAQTTDERGEYRFQQVPGRYYVGAGVPGDGAVPAVFSAGPGKPEMRIAPRVYPNSAGVEGATPLDVRPGQQYGGIDLHLPTVAAYRVRGAVRPWGSWTGPKSLYLVRREGGGGGFDSMLALDKDGGFEAAGVLPGNYWLQSLAVSMVGASVAVEVTDRDVEGVVFPLLPPVEVKGHLRFDEDGAHDLSKMHIRLTRLDTGHLLGEADAEIEAGETFQFHRLAAAQTALEMTPPSDYFLQSATYNQRPVESGVLDLTAATTGELEIVVGSGTGTVTGTLRDMTRRAAAVLAPAAGVTGNTGVRSADIDPNGGFRFPFVPPGRYYIWAVANFDPDHWQNMDFVTQMQQSGTAVEVEKKGTAQVEIRAVIE